jgi:opacity protein-like surface antigen
MKICFFAVGILLLASLAIAADIDGKWTGQYNSGMGDPMTLAYTFKANGNTLTGTTLGGPDGQEIPIKDGKIDGNKISFVVSVNFNGTDMKFRYKGVLSGDEIKLTFDTGTGGGPGGSAQGFTVKRVR